MMMGKVNDIAAAGVTHVWLPPPLHSVANESHPPLFTLKNIEDTADTGSDMCPCLFSEYQLGHLWFHLQRGDTTKHETADQVPQQTILTLELNKAESCVC
jgi:hypothetical protein